MVSLPGKLPVELLQRAFFSNIGKGDRVILPPMVGGDAGVIDIEGYELLAAHSDPITASHSRIGWLSIHIAANDIAASGFKPSWFITTLILPEGTKEEAILSIATDMKKAITELGGSLLGGHTEFSSAVSRAVIITTALGAGKREDMTPTSNAKPGDFLIMTKKAALEATSIAAHDLSQLLLERGLTISEIVEAKRYIDEISVVPEARILSSNRLANAMHDPTEGGIAAAAFEISYASGWAVELWKEPVTISDISKKILETLGVDPLFSLSSGTLLASIPPHKLETALQALSSAGIEASVIGKVLEKRERKLYLIKGGNIEMVISEIPQDDFIKRLSELGATEK